MTARLRTVLAATILTGGLPPRWPGHVPCRDNQSTFDAALDHLERASSRDRHTADVAAARSICRSCDMQDICREWALAHAEGLGVWGATTPAQRTAIVRRRRRR
jgi:hypothetical protein